MLLSVPSVLKSNEANILGVVIIIITTTLVAAASTVVIVTASTFL